MTHYKLVKRRTDARMFWLARLVYWVQLFNFFVHAAGGQWTHALTNITAAVMATWVLELGRAHLDW